MRLNPNAIGKTILRSFPLKRLEPVGAEGQHGKRGRWELLHATRPSHSVQVQSDSGFAQRSGNDPRTFAATDRVDPMKTWTDETPSRARDEPANLTFGCSPSGPASLPPTTILRFRSRSWATGRQNPSPGPID